MNSLVNQLWMLGLCQIPTLRYVHSLKDCAMYVHSLKYAQTISAAASRTSQSITATYRSWDRPRDKQMDRPTNRPADRPSYEHRHTLKVFCTGSPSHQINKQPANEQSSTHQETNQAMGQSWASEQATRQTRSLASDSSLNRRSIQPIEKLNHMHGCTHAMVHHAKNKPHRATSSLYRIPSNITVTSD